MVETQTQSKKPETPDSNVKNIDIGEIVGKVTDFVNNAKGLISKPMNVDVESFDFAISKKGGEYLLSFNASIAIKSKG
jgi:hypothetical protein